MKKTLVCIGVCAVLSACGGGSNSASNPVQLQPLSAQQTYIGTVSFGDTISVQIDTTAHTVTVNFVNSQFGLTGKLVGTYNIPVIGGNYVANTGFAAIGTVPTALSAGANGMGLQFSIVTDSNNNATLSGQMTNVPNVAANNGTYLSGQVAASNNGVKTLAALAGTYSFIKLSGNYSADGVPQGDQDADSGQIKINADGSFRACPSAAYSDICMDDQNPGTADIGTIKIDPNQTSFPGAFDMTMNGALMGRLFVSTTNGQNTLMLDQAGTNSGGTFRTGSWVLQSSTQALATNAYDGAWSCAEPDTSDTNQLLGTITPKTVTIAGTTVTPVPLGSSSPMTLSYNTTFNAATSLTLPTPVSGVDGIMSGLLSTQFAGSPVQSAMIFLPVSTTQIYYLDEVNGNGFFVEGLCTKQGPM